MEGAAAAGNDAAQQDKWESAEVPWGDGSGVARDTQYEQPALGFGHHQQPQPFGMGGHHQAEPSAAGGFGGGDHGYGFAPPHAAEPAAGAGSDEAVEFDDLLANLGVSGASASLCLQ